MSFRSVFIALVVGFGLVLAGYLVNAYRPRNETDQPSAAFVRASGKCAECHLQQQYSVVHEYELSAHARKNVTCLECHQPATGDPAVMAALGGTCEVASDASGLVQRNVTH